MARKAYPTDLSDAEWELVQGFMPDDWTHGRLRRTNLREVLNGIIYVLRTGCAWRMLPHDLPPWQTVYDYFRRFQADGTWQKIHDSLRGELRREAGRLPHPRAAVLDSQSVKTTEKDPLLSLRKRLPASFRQPECQNDGKRGVCGYDAGKQVKGRKRHILVDSLGLLLMVVVTAANVQDRDGAQVLLARLKGQFPLLKWIWADGAYAGKLVDWVKVTYGWLLKIVKRSDDMKGFQVLPKRWVVERTFAWLSRYRRFSKDYEFLTQTSETLV